MLKRTCAPATRNRTRPVIVASDLQEISLAVKVNTLLLSCKTVFCTAANFPRDGPALHVAPVH
jgi:hypothetical protein